MKQRRLVLHLVTQPQHRGSSLGSGSVDYRLFIYILNVIFYQSVTFPALDNERPSLKNVISDTVFRLHTINYTHRIVLASTSDVTKLTSVEQTSSQTVPQNSY